MNQLGLRMPDHGDVSYAPTDSVEGSLENQNEAFQDEFNTMISELSTARAKKKKRRMMFLVLLVTLLVGGAIVFALVSVTAPTPADETSEEDGGTDNVNSNEGSNEEKGTSGGGDGKGNETEGGDDGSGIGGGDDLMSQLEVAEEVVEACSRLSLKTPHGRSECENLCSSKLCCFAEDESFNCADDLSEQCIVYAACENLLGHTAEGTLPEEEEKEDPSANIKQELEAKCSKESLLDLSKIGECHELCQFHLCCFADEKDENCYNDHKVECDVYGPCAGLVHPPQAKGKDKKDVDITLALVTAACSETSLANSEGLKDCHAFCGPHLCCFINSHLKSSCVDNAVCDKYEPCKVLVDTQLHVEIPPPPADLADKCAESNLDLVAGFVECEERCDKAKCCEEPIENCVVTNPSMCDAYENACEGIKGRIPAAPSNLNDLCSDSNLATKDGFSECHQTCERASCCDLLDDACTVTNSERCGGYEICGAVFDGVDDYPDEFDTPTEVNTGEVFVPDAPDNIEKICTPSAIQSVDGYTTCNETCKNADCCEEPISVCTVLNPDSCKPYEVCAVLTGDAGEMVDVFCETESVNTQDGNQICESLCSERECCRADGSGNCYATDKAWCDEFKRCENLHQTGPDEKKTFSLHSDMDSCKSEQVSTKNGKDICRQVCLGRECCFLDGLESCKEEEKEWCKEYNLCYIVFPDGLP